MGKWIRRHGYAIGACTRLLRARRAGAILTLGVLGLVLALPLDLDVLLMNVRADSASLPPPLQMSVYLKPEVSERSAQQLAVSARARSDVASVNVISAAQALQDFRAQSGLGSSLDALGANPLPTVLEVTPTPTASSPAALEALRAALSAWPQTDSVQLDRDWARRLDALRILLVQLLRVSATLIALAVVAIIANTMRLEIQERRDEIELGKLIGGSNAFVRRPFLYLGACYGIAAALIAWGIVTLTGRALVVPLSTFAATYGTHLVPHPPGRRELVMVFGAGLILGWLGAAIAAARQLSGTTPASGR